MFIVEIKKKKKKLKKKINLSKSYHSEVTSVNIPHQKKEMKPILHLILFYNFLKKMFYSRELHPPSWLPVVLSLTFIKKLNRI